MSAESIPLVLPFLHPALPLIYASPFDLVARAELALDGCTALTNPERSGQPYSYVEFHTEPPVALHAPWDYGDSAGHLLESLTLARIMTGTAPDERDDSLAQLLRDVQREDGLITVPADPWTHTHPVVEMEWSQRAALLAWTTRYLALDDKDALHRAERMVHALHRNAVWERDLCWYPASYLPEKGWMDKMPPIDRMQDVLIGGQLIFPLARFGEVAANDEAIQLAYGLTRFLRERSGAFERDGHMTPKAARYLHSNTSFLLGVLKVGLVTNRDELVEWVQSAYNFLKEWGTDFGFFPWRTSGPDRWQGDTCATADMIAIALLLGMHGDPAYLAEAERYGRNHLLEAQILGMDWVENPLDVEFCPEVWCAQHPPEGVTGENVCQRALGTFASWTRPNDAFDPANPRLMLRATAAGTRSLYDLWHATLVRPEEAVTVNLHFSKDTRWATVTALDPREGGVEILLKTHGVLAVRIPPTLTHDQIEVRVNGIPRHETIRHGFVWLEALRNGDTVVLKWPLEEQAVRYELNGEHFTGSWRGDTLLRIHPNGLLSPLYMRSLTPQPAPPRGASGPLKEIASL